ncbi:hypothetical protein [Paenibacillus solani]|uniref:hypothetical protein n=1 Tax=Paenibacillus solani TaxID=1705565 RepID=UPI003D274ECA
MKLKAVSFLIAMCLLCIVTAYLGKELVDLGTVEVETSTNSQIVEVGTQVELQALFTGILVSNNDKPNLLDAFNRGEGKFIGIFTFPDTGLQADFIHLYEDDNHIIKKKQVEVL